VPDSIQSPLTDKARVIATITGLCVGSSALLFNPLIKTPLMGFSSAQIQLLIILGWASLAGGIGSLLARRWLLSQSHAIGMGARLGIRAGFTAAAVVGGLFTLSATLEVMEAGSAASEQQLKLKSWVVQAVSLAALLPSVLCGFISGMLGGLLTKSRLPVQALAQDHASVKGMRFVSFGLFSLIALSLASPFSLWLTLPVIDPPLPIVAAPKPPPPPPPFHYQPPLALSAARVGEIQPAFSKLIANVQNHSPISMSPDGTLIAYGDTSSQGTAIGVYDLNRFIKTASIGVPAFTDGNLAWAPDQKSLACTIGTGNARRIWVLSIAESKAIELPRPPGRDVPSGELYWWQEHELAFFPSDEAPLVFDLQRLTLATFDQSDYFSKLGAESQKSWMQGPRNELPSQSNWKLGLRTLIRSAIPPSRHNLNDPWQFSGETICAMMHPELPLAFGFKSLGVVEGSRVLCSPDGSMLARPLEGSLEVTYMRKAQAPQFFLEVDMPISSEEVDGTDWSQTVKSTELCVLLCAPLQNPLNNRTVGPDFDRVCGLAQLVQWQERKAVFMVQSHDDGIRSGDVASTPHFWQSGKMSEWNPSLTRNWWSLFTLISDTQPESLPEIESPRLLRLIAEPASVLAAKAHTEPHSATPTRNSDPNTVVPPRSIGEIEVRAFLVEHHAKASRGDVVGMMANYDQMVDFLDKGRIPQATIQADGMAYRQKWPQCSEEIDGDIRLKKSEDGIWQAHYTIQFHNENGSGEWHKGKADLSMILRVNGQGLFITSQKARVYEVTDGKGSSQTTSGNVPVLQQKAAACTPTKTTKASPASPTSAASPNPIPQHLRTTPPPRG
jgi:hypothetical protein